jgi:hypothetical protein
MFENLKAAVLKALPWKKESVASVLVTFYTAADKLDAIAEREETARDTADKAADAIWMQARDHGRERNRAIKSARFLRSIGDDV